MSDPRQIAMLQELSEDRSDAAGRRLGHAHKLHRESAARLELLQGYRNEYRTRLSLGAARGVTPDELRNFREFLERLEQAIAQQGAEVETLARGAQECRALWLAERRRGQSFGVLAERASSAERGRAARREQKLLDELSGQRALRRAAS